MCVSGSTVSAVRLLIKPLCEFEVEETTWVCVYECARGANVRTAGERFWKLRVETHVQYASDATAVATPFYTIILTPPLRHRQTLARCKRLRKLVALLLPSAWLMWFYHRRTSVCLGTSLGGGVSRPNVIFIGLAPLGPPGKRRVGLRTWLTEFRCGAERSFAYHISYLCALLDGGKTFRRFFNRL